MDWLLCGVIDVISKLGVLDCFVRCCREFRLVLTPDRSVFAEDAVFEGSSGRRVQFDPGKAYSGTLEGKFNSDSRLIAQSVQQWTVDNQRQCLRLLESVDESIFLTMQV